MVEIVNAGRTNAADVVAFEVEWDGELPAGAEAEWSCVVTSQDGEESLRLELSGRDGVATGQRVVDEASGRTHDVRLDADLREQAVTARFPASQVGVAADWRSWRVLMSVDGEQVAELRGAG